MSCAARRPSMTDTSDPLNLRGAARQLAVKEACKVYGSGRTLF